MRHMVVIVPELTGYGSIRHIAVSLPYASQLIDHVKYMEPQDVKPPEGDTERRRQRAPRGPSLRSLVRLACGATARSNSASDFEDATSARRAGQAGTFPEADRELGERLDRLLVD